MKKPDFTAIEKTYQAIFERGLEHVPPREIVEAIISLVGYCGELERAIEAWQQWARERTEPEPSRNPTLPETEDEPRYSAWD